MIDELFKLSPTISDPQEVAAGNRNRPSDADLRPLEPFPQAPQSRDPPAADPGPVNPEDNRRFSVYPQVEVEPTADVCPSGPARDAVDQGRDGRIIWAGSRRLLNNLGFGARVLGLGSSDWWDARNKRSQR